MLPLVPLLTALIPLAERLFSKKENSGADKKSFVVSAAGKMYEMGKIEDYIGVTPETFEKQLNLIIEELVPQITKKVREKKAA